MIRDALGDRRFCSRHVVRFAYVAGGDGGRHPAV